MKPIFAMNPRLKNSRTGKVMGKYHRGYAEPATAEQVKQRLTAADVKEDTRLIREEGREELKDEGLMTLCPHYSQFKDNHRCQACIIPEAFTYKTCVDVDEKELVEQAIRRALELNQDPMSDWQDMVDYIEKSPREKVHIWLRMPVGKTIEETQRDFCSEIEVPYDESCITPERYINCTGDVVYMSDRWLQPLTDEEIEERREAFLLRGLDVDGRPLKKPETALPAAQGDGTTTAALSAAPTCATPDAVIPANDRTRYILRECLKEAELSEKDLCEKGGRHNAFKSVLSVGATQLLTEAEFIAVAQELSPAYSQEKEFRQLVSDFYGKYTDASQKLNQFQRRVFARSRKIGNVPATATPQEAAQEAQAEPVYGDTASLSDIYASPTPPKQSPKARPAFVKAATAPVPKDGKETASQAMFAPLGMYCDASFVYDDGTPREPRGNCLIIAGTGGGKDNTTKFMLKHLETPRQLVDEPNRKILANWKAECKRKEGKNEDKPERPANVAVRSVASDITKARLSELMADSEGRIIHTRMIEFDQWFGVEGWRPSPNCPFTNLKLTDDEDNPFGQERVGKDSITYRGPLSINWNSSTTVSKALYYFRNNMTDGPISRLTLATAPQRPLGAPMPKHGKYDEKYDASLKPFIDNLCKAKGLITCKPAIKLVQRLKKELDEYSIKSGDEVFDNLGHRALVAAFRKACLLYAANGMKWERSIEGFCRWSLHYDLWLKLSIFGDAIRSADGEVKTSHRGPRNLLAQLGQEFNRQALVAARLANSMKEEGTDNQLSQWLHRDYIEKIGDDLYRQKSKSDR